MAQLSPRRRARRHRDPEAQVDSASGSIDYERKGKCHKGAAIGSVALQRYVR